MRVKKQRRDTSQGTCPRGPCPKSVNPPLGVGSTELSGLKRTDLVECGWEGKGVFLGWVGGAPFSPHHIIWSLWSSKCFVKVSPHPAPPRRPQEQLPWPLLPPLPCSPIPAPISWLGKLRYPGGGGRSCSAKVLQEEVLSS